MTKRRRLAKPNVGRNRGNAGKGRPRGALNKNSVVLKDAILLAAAAVGEDGAGFGGLQGYLQRIARKEPKSMAMLLARVLPLQVSLDLKDRTAVLLEQLQELNDGSHSTSSDALHEEHWSDRDGWRRFHS